MNKKILIAFVVFGFIAAQHINAQTDSALISPLPKHEIGVSYGLLPIFYVMVVVNESTLACPNFNYSYMYNFNAKHAIGTTISFLFSTYASPKDEERYLSFSQQFQYRITYLRKKKMNLYFSMGLGIVIIDSEDNIGFLSGRYYVPSYQVDFLGISFGMNAKHNGSVELGWGNQGILKIGYKYKF